MRNRRVRLAAALSLVALAAPASAQGSRPVLPSGEATFHSGLGILLSATYPPDTLHVGMTGGQESSRAYLSFELPTADDDVVLDEVVLTVPVASDAGTAAPDTAQISVCSAPGGVEDGAAAAPEADCEPSLTAEFRAGTDAAFIADVTDLVRGDRLDIALVPSGGDGWHVAFDSRNRSGGSPASVIVSFVETAPSTSVPRPDFTTPAPTPTAPALGSGALAIPDLSPPPVAAGRAVAQEAAATDATPSTRRPAAATGGGGFQYPAVFAVPLLLLVAIGVAGDGLTRPVELREEHA